MANYSGSWSLSQQMQAAGDSAWVSPKLLTLSPAFMGKTVWDLSLDGPLNLDVAGTWTVTPAINITVIAKIWGASGGSAIIAGAGGIGGPGGYATGTFTLVANTSYTFIVGSAGKYYNIIGSPGGGDALYSAAGSGGGYSGIKAGATPILIAGAGGGGGGNDDNICGNGGCGGGSSGTRGGGGNSANSGGYPGTQVGGGAGGTGNYWDGTAGSAYQGGTGGNRGGSGAAGGGGGAGYYGGGGGAGQVGINSDGGGGGGGSGYYNPTYVTSATLTAGDPTTMLPGNDTDPTRGSAGTAPGGQRVIGYPGKVYVYAV